MRFSDLDSIFLKLTQPDGLFPVEQKDIEGVSYKVFVNGPDTLGDILSHSTRHGTKDFLVYNEERYSFSEIHQLTLKVAHQLNVKFNVQKGDRIAIAMRNLPEWIISFLAITSLGAVAVPLNSWWRGEELSYALEDSGAKLIFTDQQRLECIMPYVDRHKLSIIVARGDNSLQSHVTAFSELTDVKNSPLIKFEDVQPDDLATIFYTSGSTGYPKGVVSSHRQVLSAVMSWVTLVTAIKMTTGDDDGQAAAFQNASLLPIPLFHVSGCHSIMLLSLFMGSKIVMMDKYDPNVVLELIEAEKITSFNGVPTMSVELARLYDAGKHDLSTLKEVHSSGAARPTSHLTELNEKLPFRLITTGYGLTESNALGCINAGTDYALKPKSVGHLIPPLSSIKIIDDDGESLPVLEVGEICLKSAAVAKGYWNNKAATDEVFVDGWLRTGDLGYLDDEGFLYIVDRKKDLIIRGGENISCLEVENALLDLPMIYEASVFGIPDDRLGETVGAAIQLAPENLDMDGKAIKEALSDRLAHFKIPEHFHVQSTSLPRIASGKVDKASLKKQLIQELA
ncbi:MAG: acyl--CoA ligase [Emcibacter sp.]|nr:acyl--CoA ligase [Emcibacter sp.]